MLLYIFVITHLDFFFGNACLHGRSINELIKEAPEARAACSEN
jgi:hypothetical protein